MRGRSVTAERPSLRTENHLPTVDIENASLSRGGTPILRAVTWSAKAHEFWGIIGPNGSGKSSLAQMLAGYYYPTEGTVTVLGETFGRTELHALRKRIAFLSMAKIYEVDRFLKAEEIAASGLYGTLSLFDDPGEDGWRIARSKMEELGISGLAERTMWTLSDGEKMKVLLARALVSKSELLILDEPTSGLDIPSREACLEAIARMASGADSPTTIVITHHPEELPRTLTHCLLMSAGAVHSQGPAREVISSAALSEVYKVPMTVSHDDGRFWVRTGRK